MPHLDATSARISTCLPGILLCICSNAHSQQEEVIVYGRWDNPIGMTVSAAQGVVGAEEIDARPRLRTGEILEVVPGLIVTQHSGTGKSNQMFLRGFNLDHGTDFATWVDGMPVNMPTHGHGQGYTDLNFLIPELIERIEYRKGNYYAEVSDFSSAGAAYLSTFNTLDQGMIRTGIGEDGYFRVLAADSFQTGNGQLLYGLQTHRYDGPWTDINEDLKRNNALLRFSSDGKSGGSWNIALMAYDARWNSADQIPQRAVSSGLVSRLGSIDTTVGGDSSRHSLSGSWNRDLGWGRARLAAYFIDYSLNLFSNFTYLLDDPVNGDQFEQLDDRTITGGEFALDFGSSKQVRHTIGASLRMDAIGDVGLFRTSARQRLETVRRDSVDQLSLGLFYQGELKLAERLRAIFGVRADYYDFDVTSDLLANSGTADDTLLSPKINLIYALSPQTELYASAGRGFHSNDARGTTISIDPASGDPAETVSPLVASESLEIGFRAFTADRLSISASLWQLELDSELLFVGDAGNTEASLASRRRGIEVPVYYRLSERVTLDLELAFTDSKFTDPSPDGDHIPGAIDEVVAAGITVSNPNGLYGSLRARHFGPRPLVEDGSAESDSSTVFSGSIGYRSDKLDFRLDLLNLLDSSDDDITYLYSSRLPGEPADGVEDRHFHPMEPRTARLYFTWAF